jgi:hypothetical protein
MSESLSPDSRSPLVSFSALQSIICIEVSRLIGYLLPASASLFPASPRGLPDDAVPRASLKERVHPLLSLASTSESVADPVPPLVQGPPAPPVRFRSLSRHEHRGFTIRLESLRVSGPSSAFLPLSTACSPRSLAGLFHPAATSGIHPTRVFPAAEPALLIGVPFLHGVSHRAPVIHRSESRQHSMPHLQGLAPGSNPLPLAEGLAPPTTRSPLEFSRPCGSSFGSPGDAFAPHPLWPSMPPSRCHDDIWPSATRV